MVRIAGQHAMWSSTKSYAWRERLTGLHRMNPSRFSGMADTSRLPIRPVKWRCGDRMAHSIRSWEGVLGKDLASLSTQATSCRSRSMSLSLSQGSSWSMCIPLMDTSGDLCGFHLRVERPGALATAMPSSRGPTPTASGRGSCFKGTRSTHSGYRDDCKKISPSRRRLILDCGQRRVTVMYCVDTSGPAVSWLTPSCGILTGSTARTDSRRICTSCRSMAEA